MMIQRVIIFILVGCFCLSANVFLLAQESAAIDIEKYQKLQKELNIDKTKSTLVLKDDLFKKEELKAPKYSPNNYSNTILQNFINILGYLAIFGTVIALLIFVFNKVKFKEKFEISPTDEDYIEDIEAVDVKLGLKLALSQRNYRLAIRMKFIELLQFLQAKEIIDWMPDKTNRDYVYEIENKNSRKKFKTLSSTYEFVWYGNTEVSESDFLRIDPKFNSFMLEINE